MIEPQPPPSPPLPRLRGRVPQTTDSSLDPKFTLQTLTSNVWLSRNADVPSVPQV